jgi:phosphoglucomutase/phosphomannomutase
LAGIGIATIRDYDSLTVTDASGSRRPLAAPRGDLVVIDLAAEGNYVAIRPSGTEPKVKCYISTYHPAELLHDLTTTQEEMAERIRKLSDEFRRLAAAV